LAGNGHVDQGRCPDIDAFLVVNLPSGCTLPRSTVKAQRVEISATANQRPLHLMRKILRFAAMEPEETGNHSSRACSDKTLKAGSWRGLRSVRRDHKPGTEQFQGVDGRWWLRHQVIDKNSLHDKGFLSQGNWFTFHQTIVGMVTSTGI